jgi:hypothetical protein
MTRSSLVVSAVVALICGGILVVFTHIEVTVMRWVHCGPLAPETARLEKRCRP